MVTIEMFGDKNTWVRDDDISKGIDIDYGDIRLELSYDMANLIADEINTILKRKSAKEVLRGE